MDYENDTSWVRGMLHPGENLLWTGRPQKGRLFRREDRYMIPFSLLWCGFAIFWEISVIKSRAPLLFRLWGIPFVLVGLYITVGRFFVRSFQEKNSRYALTSQRIIAQNGKTRKVLDLLNLPGMTVNLNNDGSGDILFGENAVAQQTAMFPAARRTATVYPLEMRNIPDANSVEYRIRTAVNQAISATRAED